VHLIVQIIDVRPGYMRELCREEVSWIVREADTSRMPGARGERCLIFDSESVVRRVWQFPTDWQSLDDDALWALTLKSQLPAAICGARPAMRPALASAITLAVETSERARRLIGVFAALSAENLELRSETTETLARCRESRAAMRNSVEAFAAAMRTEGVAPEEAIVLIKGAVIDGVGPAAVTDDPDAQVVMREAVAWGIAAYYAA
jgi:hypothetical protein